MENPTISVTVRNRVATVSHAAFLVCGNSDYRIRFLTDEEWEKYPEKTARFVYVKNGLTLFQEVLFSGDTVEVPAFYNITEVAVGIYAGEICTTTPARIPCSACITDNQPQHDAPSPDLYNQLLKYLSELRRQTAISAALHVSAVQNARAQFAKKEEE